MVTRGPRPALIAVIVAFVLASVGLTLFVWQSVGGTLPLNARGYRVQMSFANASTLAPNADVRIAGVSVGKVIAIRQRGLRTDATVELKRDFAPLSADARAGLRLKSLLGETFVAVTPGRPGTPTIREGGRLPERQVRETQPLDRVLGMLDAPTRRDMDTLLASGATIVQHRQADLSGAFGNLDPVSRQLATISSILSVQRRSVAAIVRDGGTVLRTVAERRAAVRELASAGDALAAETAARNRSLTATTRVLPGLLRQLQHTSERALTTARIARPTLAQLREVAPLVAPAMDALNELSPQLLSILRQLRRTLPTARRALPAAAHFVDTLVPFVEKLYPAAREIVPIISVVKAYRREINATVANVAAATQGTAPGGPDDKPVHYLRALIPITEEATMGYRKRLGSNRHNAYHAPGELEQLTNGNGLQASSCANAGNAQLVPVIGPGAPACHEQGPWTFGGTSAYFPHVGRLAP